jgi:hypothetical protein
MTIAEASWDLLEALILSEQVPDDRLQQMLIVDPAFADWLRERAKNRQGA